MKITLQMIVEKLKEVYPKVRIPSIKSSSDMHINGVKIYSPKLRTYSEDHLYIGRSEDLSSDEQELPPVFFCCCKQKSTKKGRELIRIITELDVAEIFNTIQEIYAQFQAWDRAMHEALIKGDSISQILESTGRILNNPILIYDLSLKLLAHSKVDLEKDPLMKETVSMGYLPMPVMLEFERAGVFSKTRLTEPLSLSPSSYRPQTSAVLYQPFYHNSSPSGYCVMLMSHLEATDYDRTMFANFYESAQISMERMMDQNNIEGFMYEYALKDILDNPNIPEETVRERFSYMNLPFESEYFLVSMNTAGTGASARSYLLNQLHSTLSSAIAFEFKEKILILIYNKKIETLSYREQIPQAYPEVLSAMESYSITACCSMPFYKITGLQEAWRMDEEAFVLRNLLKLEQNRIFFFEDHIVQAMCLRVLELTSNLPSIPASIKIMLDRDREHHTQNAFIVRTYLEENCRITETAAKLHMHRNNIVYHIKRIEEQYHIDFSSQSERLKLQMTFQLLDLITIIDKGHFSD